MTFRRQLLIGYTALLGVLLIIGAAATIALRVTSEHLEHVARDLTSDVVAVHRLRFQAEDAIATDRGYLLTGSREERVRYRTEIIRLEGTLRTLDKLPAPGIAAVNAAVRNYVAVSHAISQRRTTTAHPGALVPYFESTVAPARRRVDTAISRFMDSERTRFDRQAAHARGTARTTQVVVLAATAAGIALSIALATMWYRRLATQYQRELDATERARKAVAARDDLLAVVSHDLRNPLSAVTMGASLLAEEPAGPRANVHIATIGNAAGRMAALIDELLDVAKLESGKLELQREPVAIAALLDSTAGLFQSRAATAKLRLEIDTGGEPLVASADRERILQVLSNLVGNALKYAPASGRVALRGRREGDVVRVSVTDNGPGVAPEQIPHLFERYWQGRPRGRGSLGLGLYICKQIVEAHGGEIGVETAPGAGSTFWFTLPA